MLPQIIKHSLNPTLRYVVMLPWACSVYRLTGPFLQKDVHWRLELGNH